MVTKTPGVCGGAACIDTTRVPVWSLQRLRDLFDDKGILEQYPFLTQDDLNDAWAYVREHPEEIQQNIRENS